MNRWDFASDSIPIIENVIEFSLNFLAVSINPRGFPIVTIDDITIDKLNILMVIVIILNFNLKL